MKKSFMNRVLAVSLSAAMAFTLSSATSLTAPEAAAKKLPANKKAASMSLKVGKSKVLKLKNYKAWNIKSGATNKKAVAAVKATGTKAKRFVKVTAKKKGTAKITLLIGKRKKANSKNTNYTKTIKKVVTVKVKKAATTTPADTTPTDTTPTDTTPTDTTVTPGKLNISQVTAKKVDTLAVSFSSVVASPSSVNVTLTRGTTNIEIKNKTWNADGNELTIETTAKMTKGTYTVTATDGTDTTTGTVEIVDQTVKEIKFLNETALTGKDAQEAYVYYDVLDQYGESMKDVVSIQWTASTGQTQIPCDRAKGRLTLRKTKTTTTTGSSVANEKFNYGDQIYVTGVYTKTGVSNSGTFKVGTAQSVDTVKFAGFLKKGTTKIEEKLPAGFKENEYQLLYNVTDQNDCPLDADDYVSAKTNDLGGLTFISDNVLVVKGVSDQATGNKTVTINGTEYCATTVTPGDNVNSGGTVNLSAISTKTGKKSTLNFVVGAYRVLKSFSIETPSDVVADGEEVSLPFTATDAEGNKMTNFVELASQSDFSKLTFSAGQGTLKLKQNDDGSAKLEWKDTSAEGQWNSKSEDGIDRPVSLTSIVVGGETSNQMIYVSDKARPDAISGVDLSEVMVNGSEEKITLANFTFLDQYGRTIKEEIGGNRAKLGRTAEGNGHGKFVLDNGFFNYVNNSGLSGTDYTDYKFYVNVEVTGEKGLGDATNVSYTSDKDQALYSRPISGGKYNHIVKEQRIGGLTDGMGFTATFFHDAAVVEPTLKFSIQKQKGNVQQAEKISKDFTKTFQLVSLNTVSNITVNDLKKFQIRTDATEKDNAEAAGVTAGSITRRVRITSHSATGEVLNPGDVEAKASYNGKSLNIPKAYIKAMGDKLGTKTGGYSDVQIVTTGDIKYSDLYDSNSTHFSRKDASDTLTVTIAKQVGYMSDSANKLTDVKKTALISDARESFATFTSADNVTIHPVATYYELGGLLNRKRTVKDANGIERTLYIFESKKFIKDLADASKDKVLEIKDQYGETVYKYDARTKVEEGKLANSSDLTFEYLIKDQAENKTDGYVENNFRVNSNSTKDANLEGAERGDKFTVVVTAKSDQYGTISKTVGVTVGSDDDSQIVGQSNVYKDSVLAELKAQLQRIFGK